MNKTNRIIIKKTKDIFSIDVTRIDENNSAKNSIVFSIGARVPRASRDPNL